MSLSVDEKNLMRMALCEGAFSDSTTPGPKTITPQTLIDIAAMADEPVRAVLRVYKARKLAALQTALAGLAEKENSVNAHVAALESIVIAD